MMKVDDRNMNLAMEAFQAFTDTYFEILGERRAARLQMDPPFDPQALRMRM